MKKVIPLILILVLCSGFSYLRTKVLTNDKLKILVVTKFDGIPFRAHLFGATQDAEDYISSECFFDKQSEFSFDVYNLDKLKLKTVVIEVTKKENRFIIEGKGDL